MTQSTITEISQMATVTIRKVDDTDLDRERLRRLVEVDTSEALEGAVLAAEVEGAFVAAISIADGKTIADPFARTAELRSLLELRAAQIRRRASHRRGFAIRSPRPRAALASSPPGAGGKLLELPRWG